jgi:hypothetical protein
VRKILSFIRHNTIALIALFLALGGTSYAALNLPAGSVGTTQLKDHSVTPSKLDPTPGGYIRYWAEINADGYVFASRPHATNLYGRPVTAAMVTWHKPIPKDCFSVANPAPAGATGPATPVVAQIYQGTRRTPTFVLLGTASIEPVDVLVICPQP